MLARNVLEEVPDIEDAQMAICAQHQQSKDLQTIAWLTGAALGMQLSFEGTDAVFWATYAATATAAIGTAINRIRTKVGAERIIRTQQDLHPDSDPHTTIDVVINEEDEIMTRSQYDPDSDATPANSFAQIFSSPLLAYTGAYLLAEELHNGLSDIRPLPVIAAGLVMTGLSLVALTREHQDTDDRSEAYVQQLDNITSSSAFLADQNRAVA